MQENFKMLLTIKTRTFFSEIIPQLGNVTKHPIYTRMLKFFENSRNSYYKRALDLKEKITTVRKQKVKKNCDEKSTRIFPKANDKHLQQLRTI